MKKREKVKGIEEKLANSLKKLQNNNKFRFNDSRQIFIELSQQYSKIKLKWYLKSGKSNQQLQKFIYSNIIDELEALNQKAKRIFLIKPTVYEQRIDSMIYNKIKQIHLSCIQIIQDIEEKQEQEEQSIEYANQLADLIQNLNALQPQLQQTIIKGKKKFCISEGKIVSRVVQNKNAEKPELKIQQKPTISNVDSTDNQNEWFIFEALSKTDQNSSIDLTDADMQQIKLSNLTLNELKQRIREKKPVNPTYKTLDDQGTFQISQKSIIKQPIDTQIEAPIAARPPQMSSLLDELKTKFNNQNMGQILQKICQANSNKMQILLVGDFQSGKTTFLYGNKLKPGWDQQEFKPTQGYNYEEVIASDVIMGVWDTPGQEFLFPLVRALYTHLKMDAIVYVFRLSRDPQNYIKAKRQIRFLANEPTLKHCKLAVVVNKAEEIETQFSQKTFLTQALGIDKLKRGADAISELFVINCKYSIQETQLVWNWISDY